MKTCLRLVWASIVLLTFAQVANSQGIMPNGGYGNGPGGFDSGFQPLQGDLNLGLPGRIWVGGSYADQGLGYIGSYFTIGAKTRLFEDALDGRWLSEARAHYATDEGNFFGNFGIERVISIRQAGADVSFGGWIDYDGDARGNFAHEFTQLGLSGSIKTRTWDLIANGYFPVGTTDFATGSEGDCFFGSSLILRHGTDSALKGFDATLRLRPQMLGMLNGTIDLGGYGYGSELVEYFGGGRVRLGMQMLPGMIVNAEVTQDDRFDTTYAVGATWMYGVNARGTAYGGLGRDLERTVRNDHIVRFQQDVIVAVNPDTGAAYNVIHVDNTANVAFETGDVETPFRALASAEAASNPNDIIVVNAGDGTTRFYDTGIVLQDGQYLLGSGGSHVIPVQGGLNLVCDLDGNRPTITAQGRGDAITLANNNFVSGIIIDGAAGRMGNGIRGNGLLAGSPLRNGTINNVTVTGAILHGIHLNDIEGDWTFTNNNFDSNGFDGALIEEACDPTSQFVFEDNTFNENGNDGLHLVNYDAESIVLERNQTNGNGRDGIRFENFKNGSGNGLTLDLRDHESTENAEFGVHLAGGTGNLRVLNGDISGNFGGGLRIADWTTDTDERVIIAPTAGQTSSYSNNDGGTGIDIELNSGIQNLFITQTAANGNQHGLRLATRGVGTIINAELLNNTGFNNNSGDGIRMDARGGSTQNVSLIQPAGIIGNNQSGINFLAGTNAVGVTSVINFATTNTLISQNTVGMRAIAIGDGQILANFEDMSFTLNQVHADIEVQNSTTGTPNRFLYNQVTMDNTTPLILGAGDSFRIRNLGDSLLDVVVTDSVITTSNSDYNPPGGPNGASPFVDTQGNFGEGEAFDLDLGGTNSLTRFVLRGTTVSNHNFGAINANVNGEAQLLMDITGNEIEFNGWGPGDSPLLNGTVNNIPGTPEFAGISINAGGNARIDYQLLNNSMDFNYGESTLNDGNMVQIASGNAVINAQWLENDFTNNFFGRNVTMRNLGAANTCLSMGSNLFFNNNVLFANAGAASQFNFELDGITNGIAFDFSNPQIVGAFTPQAFGSTCLPAIEASQAAFDALGFPPIEHD